MIQNMFNRGEVKNLQQNLGGLLFPSYDVIQVIFEELPYKDAHKDLQLH